MFVSATSDELINLVYHEDFNPYALRNIFENIEYYQMIIQDVIVSGKRIYAHICSRW